MAIALSMISAVTDPLRRRISQSIVPARSGLGAADPPSSPPCGMRMIGGTMSGVRATGGAGLASGALVVGRGGFAPGNGARDPAISVAMRTGGAGAPGGLGRAAAPVGAAVVGEGKPIIVVAAPGARAGSTGAFPPFESVGATTG